MRRGAAAGLPPPTDRITNSITRSAGAARRGAAAARRPRTPLRHPSHSHTAVPGIAATPTKPNTTIKSSSGIQNNLRVRGSFRVTAVYV